ncbi:E3 ubiquitin-protein ligase TRIM11-like [Tamandua tetradactyla]|uniref:E3 ubiquitin-protein ligase TRIM11-like n=1 Tax=Tamandua tetradactyla TaxID=48850 RepID=UPI0040543674
MAARSLAKDLQDEATCPICLDLFSEPVSLSCGHNFCRACVDRSWGAGDALFPCPECREPCAPRSVRPNRPLGRVAAALGRLRPPPDRGGPRDPCDLCPEHLEPLKLFCEDDRCPICVVCGCARAHRDHRVVPLEEAAQTQRENFPKMLEELKKVMKKAERLQTDVVVNSEVWQAKVQERKQRTVSEFEKFRKLLAEDELWLLQQLEEEKEVIVQKLKKEEQVLAKHSRAVEVLILELKERSERPALGLLQGLGEILNRIENLKLTIPAAISMELKTTCKVPGLLDTLRRFQVDMTLDPESAHPCLTLSDDQRTVTQAQPWGSQSKMEKLLGKILSVLGRERFSAGRHYWEVEVKDRGNWALGVCREDADRKVSALWKQDGGFWSKRDLFPTGTFNPQKTLHPRIGIFLDWEAGELSFYNVNEESHLYTIPRAGFQGPLRPIFIAPPWCQTSLTICPRPGDNTKGVLSVREGTSPEASSRDIFKPVVFVFGCTPAPDPPQPPQLDS